MCLFCEQTQMESSFGYPMAVGRATTLEGDENNSSGAGSSDIREDLPESEYYHSALTWFDEETDELESSPNAYRPS
jgi:hypothetical protein